MSVGFKRFFADWRSGSPQNRRGRPAVLGGDIGHMLTLYDSWLRLVGQDGPRAGAVHPGSPRPGRVDLNQRGRVPGHPSRHTSRQEKPVTLTRLRLARPRLLRRTAVLSALLMAIAALTSVSFGATPAYATTYVGGPDCVSAHCYEGTDQNAPSGTVGVHLTFPFLPMATGGSDMGNDGADQYHVSNTVWAVFPGNNNFIEAGVADSALPYNGWNNQNLDGSCPTYGGSTQQCDSWSYDSYAASQSPSCSDYGCGAYYIYWGDHNQVGGVDYNYYHVVAFVSPSFDPPTEYVDILWNYHGDNQWALNFTGNVTASDESRIDDSYHSVSQMQAGLEVYAPSGQYDCATYDTSVLGYWTYPGYWKVNWPGTPAYSGNYSTFDYLGTSNGTGQYTFTWNNGYNGC